MIDEKKLIEELHEIRKTLDTKYADKFDKGVVAGIDTAIHLLVNADKAGEWIPVENEVPDIYENVQVTYLGYEDNRLYSDGVAYIDDCGNWCWEFDDSTVRCEITAWMPLPEPYAKD